MFYRDGELESLIVKAYDIVHASRILQRKHHVIVLAIIGIVRLDGGIPQVPRQSGNNTQN
jgi:hypothetical protein